MSTGVNSAIDSLLENREFCGSLLGRLEKTLAGRKMRFMEVCGTHTVAIFHSGLRQLLPENIIHVSGPGCPVCVTHDAEVDAFLKLAERPEVVIATFGDMLRVPNTRGHSLKNARAAGASVEIVYSPLDSLNLARKFPDRQIVFLGIGFETTAPTVAATIKAASQARIKNFSVLSLHKLVPPALKTLLEENEAGIDSFLLPGHVATITGLEPFKFLGSEYNKPAAVGGFEPGDILLALANLAEQLVNGQKLANCYPRAVANEGNPVAMRLMDEVFEPVDGLWRGLGKLPQSGLKIRDRWSMHDARAKFDLDFEIRETPSACQCGQVLKGLVMPSQCPLFGKKCTPLNPVGPCMVSTEGSCSAHYKYGAI